MPVPHRKPSVNDNVKVCIEVEAHLPYEALVQTEHSRYLRSDPSDLCLRARVRCDVA